MNSASDHKNQTNVNAIDSGKSAKIMNAVLIGVMIGIVIYSVTRNNVGFFTLIPLFFIYKLVNQPGKDQSAEV